MGQSKSCAWKSPELQCKLQRNPNIKLECVKVGELSLDNPVSNRGDVKLLPSPKLHGRSDHIDAKSFILTDFKRSPFFHNSEHSLIGCEVSLLVLCTFCFLRGQFNGIALAHSAGVNMRLGHSSDGVSCTRK
jgi:hypothetical protein